MSAQWIAENLGRWAAVWADWMLASSWQLALLVALVTLVAYASRKMSARFRYLLWTLVLIKALTPPTLGTPWSVGNWIVPNDLNVASVRLERVPGLSSPDGPIFASDTTPAKVTAGSVESSVADTGLDPVQARPEAPGLSLDIKEAHYANPRAVAMVVWLTGLCLFGLFIIVRYRHLIHLLRNSSEVDEGPLRVALERLALRMGRSDPPVLLLSDAVSSPFLFGLIRPCIVLPAGLKDTLEPEQLEDILLHELTHWRRRDLAASWLQILVQGLFWFHPLVWLAGAQLRHERETACDEAALASGCSPADRYGESLLRVLLAARGRSSVALGFLGIFERNTRLQRRLEAIMNQEDKVRRLGVAGWLTLVLFAVACLPMAAVENEDISPYSSIAEGMVALQFDGQRDYLEVENSTSLTLKATPIIEGWIKVHEAAGETALLSKDDPRKSGYSIMITGVPGQESFDLVFTMGCRQRFINLTAPGAIPRDKWTHVMAIYGPGRNELWVDFKEVARQDRRIFYTPAQDVPLRIGKASADLGGYFNGEIASIRFWRVNLYHRDVNYYRVPLDGDEYGLIAAWDFFQGDGSLTDKGAGKLKAISKKGDWPEYVALIDLEIKPKSEVRLYGTGSQWQRPFVNDPDVLGHWTSLDIVENIKWFDPGRKNYQGDIYLKALDFEPEGKMKQVWSWTRGWLWHPGDKAEGKYEIRVIDGKPYLFMELINGNVTIHGQKPQYYVFEKPSASWGPKVTFEMTRGDEKTFHDARFRLVRIEEGDKNDRFDDIAEIVILTGHEVHTVTIQELYSVFQGDYEITVDDIFPNTVSPGDGRARITIRYAPEVLTHSQPESHDQTSGADVRQEVYSDEEIAGTDVQEFFDRIGDPKPGLHQFSSLWALEKKALMGDSAQRNQIIEKAKAILEDKNESIFRRWQCCYVLSGTVDEQVIPILIKALNEDPDPTVRSCAACALGRFKTDSAMQGLKKARENESIEKVLDYIDKALAEEFYVNSDRKTTCAVSSSPRIVAISPAVGSIDVDPATTEITVTFDHDMAGGMSWTGGGPYFPPIAEGKRPAWRDKRTCVLPVQLEPAKYYRVGINSTSHQNFRSADGVPAQPVSIYFSTKGAPPEVVAMAQMPEIVEMSPVNGTMDVDPDLTELRVTFNVPMGGGFSWTGGGPAFPKGREGERPHWSADGMTCIFPVTLEPGKIYRLGLNSSSHKNFTSRGGVPLNPVVYNFRTRQ